MVRIQHQAALCVLATQIVLSSAYCVWDDTCTEPADCVGEGKRRVCQGGECCCEVWGFVDHWVSPVIAAQGCSAATECTCAGPGIYAECIGGFCDCKKFGTIPPFDADTDCGAGCGPGTFGKCENRVCKCEKFGVVSPTCEAPSDCPKCDGDPANPIQACEAGKCACTKPPAGKTCTPETGCSGPECTGKGVQYLCEAGMCVCKQAQSGEFECATNNECLNKICANNEEQICDTEKNKFVCKPTCGKPQDCPNTCPNGEVNTCNSGRCGCKSATCGRPQDCDWNECPGNTLKTCIAGKCGCDDKVCRVPEDCTWHNCPGHQSKTCEGVKCGCKDKKPAHCTDDNPVYCSENPADRWVIRVSDKLIPWGTLNPGDVIDYMRGVCSDLESCQHDNQLPTFYVQDKKLINAALKITESDTSLEKEYTPGMLDVLQFTLDRVIKFEKKDYLEINSCGNNGNQCLPKDRKSGQVMGPRHIRITLKDPGTGRLIDRGTASELKLEFGFEAAGSTSLMGACGALGYAVAAILGAFNPALGAFGNVVLIGCLAVP